MILRIKELLKEKCVTTYQLAAYLGVTQPTVSSAMNGNPSVEWLNKVAQFLGVPITDLFEKEGDFVAFVRRNGVTHTFSTERELAAFVASFEGCVELDATTKP